MGSADHAQDEDCLSLTIWTPAVDDRKRPVMLWLHGGAFMTGGGGLPWYDAESLARDGDIVVVCANFRLGALGLLYLEGVSPGNLTIRDQIAALQWVHDNISAFGGDPDCVTVAGQSSGGNAIAGFANSPHAQGLFRRLILQSPAIGRPDRSKAQAQELGERYRAEVARLAGTPDPDLKAVPAEMLVAAHGGYAGQVSAGLPLGATALPFMPVVDNEWVFPCLQPPAVNDGQGPDLLIGTTREEMQAFHLLNPSVTGATAGQVQQVFEHFYGEEAQARLSFYQRRRGTLKPSELLADLYTDRIFRLAVLQYAEAFTAQGGNAYVYQFDWQSPNGFAACHCLELPFVFDNLEHWHDAPMVQGVDPVAFSGVARGIKHAWLAFIKTGKPDHDFMPPWPAYSAQQPRVMSLDTVFRVMDAQA